MKIGLTYDLRDDYLAEGFSEVETAEFDHISTIEAIEQTLQELGFETERIGHARHLMKRLALGERWEVVFNIAEGLYGFGREALIPALLEAHQIPYVFSDPLTLSLTLHKGMAKRVVRDLKIPTPDFAVVEKESDIDNIRLAFPLFAKPIAEGTGKGVTAKSKISTDRELSQVCCELLETYQQPVLVERFLPGREFTVGIVGTGEDAEVLGVLEIILNDRAEQEVYSYVNKEHCEKLVEYRLGQDSMAERAKVAALAVWRGLGCRDGGRVDLRSDGKGRLHFIEVNPLAGLHPEHSDLPILATLVGMPYRTLLEEIMFSALQRYGLSHELGSRQRVA